MSWLDLLPNGVEVEGGAGRGWGARVRQTIAPWNCWRRKTLTVTTISVEWACPSGHRWSTTKTQNVELARLRGPPVSIVLQHRTLRFRCAQLLSAWKMAYECAPLAHTVSIEFEPAFLGQREHELRYQQWPLTGDRAEMSSVSRRGKEIADSPFLLRDFFAKVCANAYDANTNSKVLPYKFEWKVSTLTIWTCHFLSESPYGRTIPTRKKFQPIPTPSRL